MKVSIVMITKNPNISWFKNAVSSVFAQSHLDIEIINVDASTNVPPLDVEDERFIRIRQTSKGLWPAFEDGFARCSGEIIGVLNSDDFLYSENVIEEILGDFVKNEVDYVYGNSVRVNQDGEFLYRFVPLRLGWYRLHKFFGLTVSHHSFYFRRSVLESCAFIDSRFQNHFDVSFILDVMHSFKGRYISIDVAGFRLHGENASASSFSSMSRFYQALNGVHCWFYIVPKLLWVAIRPAYAIYLVRRSISGLFSRQGGGTT